MDPPTPAPELRSSGAPDPSGPQAQNLPPVERNATAQTKTPGEHSFYCTSLDVRMKRIRRFEEDIDRELIPFVETFAISGRNDDILIFVELFIGFLEDII